ncbi:hypothetical protein GQ457_08G028110 [Hibiscus cannabinus]
MIPPLIAPVKDNNSGSKQVITAKLMGDSSSVGQRIPTATVMDPVVSAQTHDGLSTGFDIVMAHDEEHTLDPISDGLKRTRICSPASKVSLSGLAGGNETSKLEHPVLGEFQAIRRLKSVLRDVAPSVIFLIETKLQSSKMIKAMRYCGYVNGIDVPARGCTGFYGAHEESNIEASWSLLRQLNDCPSLPCIASAYFQDLFSSTVIADPTEILDGVAPCLTPEMNQELLHDFSVEEVHQEVRSMGPLKASGEDGLGVVFYQRYWHVIGADIATFLVLNHYNSCRHSKIFITIWALWFARNKLVHENIVQELPELARFIRGYIFELRSSSSKLAHSNVRADVRWIPPPVRRSSGCVPGSSIWGGNWVPKCYFGRRCSHSVICKMLSSDVDTSIIRSVVAEAKALSRRFQSCRFSFVGRDGNRTANAMALVAKSMAGDAFWVEEAPNSVQLAAAADRRWIDPL